jgi:hypothetical protein
MEEKPSYNDPQIKDAVRNIIQTRELIKRKLSQQKYEPLLKSLDQTIQSLNNPDSLYYSE